MDLREATAVLLINEGSGIYATCYVDKDDKQYKRTSTTSLEMAVSDAQIMAHTASKAQTAQVGQEAAVGVIIKDFAPRHLVSD